MAATNCSIHELKRPMPDVKMPAETIICYQRYIRLRLLKVLCVWLAVTLTGGCGVRSGGSGGDTTSGAGGNLSTTNTGEIYALPRSCGIEDMQSWVYANMNDYYLFYDQVEQNVALSSDVSVEELIVQLRVQPFDTFSYITEEASHVARFDAGETFGFGWLLERTQDDDFYFKLVESYSPLANKEIQRGDQLVAIDGYAMADFLLLDNLEKDRILGVDDEQTTVTFSIRNPLGITRDITVTKAVYPLETVLDASVISHNGIQVGYLHFYQFVDTSAAELAAAFAEFSQSNVTELVLDLRYNGGGRISIANELASHIRGTGHTDEVFTTFRPNDKYAANSTSINFVNPSEGLDLDRVFVLQSDDTCSASELVVNGLRPYLDVITIGSTSCGKPYATIPRAACGKVMNALELELINAAGAGGYYNGITADCPVAENLAQLLGNPAEALFETALGFMDTGSCNTTMARTQSNSLPLPRQLMRPVAGGGSL